MISICAGMDAWYFLQYCENWTSAARVNALSRQICVHMFLCLTHAVGAGHQCMCLVVPMIQDELACI